jgi:hypothetical protein
MLDREIRQGWGSQCQAQTTPFLDVIGRGWSTKVSSLTSTTEAQLCHSGVLFNRRCIPCGTIRDDQLVYVCFKLPRLMSNYLHDRLFGYHMRCIGESCNLRTLLSSLLCSAVPYLYTPWHVAGLLPRRIVVARCPRIYALWLSSLNIMQKKKKKGFRALP